MVVVMEGYMDVVSTAQSGISYAVATLGTAVTPEHLRLLWQLAKEPVICLDGDAAGNRAMLRAAEIAPAAFETRLCIALRRAARRRRPRHLCAKAWAQEF